MHVNPITNDAWKDWSVKKLKSENFLVSIDRTSIKYRSREAESFEHKNPQVRLVGRNRAKNRKYFKIGSTYQKESKEESKKAETFSLKNWIFQSIEKQIRSIETWKTKKILKTWKFSIGTFLKTSFYDMKCMSMIPNVFKNSFSSIKSIFFYQDSKIFLNNFTLNAKKY